MMAEGVNLSSLQDEALPGCHKTSTWLATTLGDVTTWTSGGTPSKSETSYWNGDIPWLSAKTMTEGWIDSSETTITTEGLDNGSRLAPPNSVLFLVRGSGLYNRRYINIVRNPVAFNQDIKCIQATNKILPIYLYYLLRGSDDLLVGMLESTGIGAGKFDLSRLQNMPIKLPPIAEQRAIAATLSCLDEKIATNTKINHHLEQMAQAIFKSWFVDFEPFRDGEFTESELGLIPKGWHIGLLSDLITIKYGRDHKKLANGTIPVFGSGGIMRFVDASLYSGESVLIPRKGTLNNVIYANQAFWSVDTMFYTIMNRPNIAKFVYFFVRSKDLVSMNAGSAVPSMTTEILNSLPIVIPPTSVLDRYEEVVSAQFRQIQSNKLENINLTAIRDLLLPRLMSGELSVADLAGK